MKNIQWLKTIYQKYRPVLFPMWLFSFSVLFFGCGATYQSSIYWFDQIAGFTHRISNLSNEKIICFLRTLFESVNLNLNWKVSVFVVVVIAVVHRVVYNLSLFSLFENTHSNLKSKITYIILLY